MISEYPTIFLSHSKEDKAIIEKLAIDLRKHRINAWYDGWEIPAGSSLREKIFSQGISECDAFLVYLTTNSLMSRWVKEEIDSGFAKLIAEKNATFIPCISDLSLADKITLELRAKKLVLLNNEEYTTAFIEIITSLYENKLSKIVEECEDEISQITKKLENDYEHRLETRRCHERRVEKELSTVKNHLLHIYEKIRPLIAPIKFTEIIRLPQAIIEERSGLISERIEQNECPACFGTKLYVIKEEASYHGSRSIGYITTVRCRYCGKQFRISNEK